MKKQHSENVGQCQDADCASGKRNRYFRHKTVGAAEFRAEQEYFLQRRRIINRSVHGWGVVAGFRLPADATGGLRIGSGLAFDRHGRELLLCEPVALTERNTFLVDADHPGQTRPLRLAEAGRYLLRAHYAERGIGDATLDPECGCDLPEKNFICESVLFSLTRLCDPERCPCAERPCDRHCACGGDCCGSGRGPHACLCEWIADGTVKCSSRLACTWKGHQLDLCDDVPLACVTLAQGKDPCNPIEIVSVEDACKPRRLVKNNDLLYDLIRGCDLTTIEKISWGEWHRGETPMPFATFKDYLGPGPVIEDDLEFALTKFVVQFSAPVLKETVTPDCFAFRITVPHTDTGWFDQRSVPVIKVKHEPPASGDPADTTRKVTLGVHPDFFLEATGRANEFTQADPDVKEKVVAEIEVYGDYILDCHHQPIDGNARGFALRQPDATKPPKPSGNGTPGGSLLSIFHIEKFIKPGKGHRGTQP